MTKPLRVTLLLSALMLTITPVTAQDAVPLSRAKSIDDPGINKRKLRSDRRLNRAPRFGAIFAKHPKGVRMRFVLPFSPAAKLGLKTGDVIAKAFGSRVSTPQQLQKLMNIRKKGDDVTLEVVGEDGWLDKVEGRLGRRSFKRLQHKIGRFVMAVVLVEFADAKHNPQFTPKDWEQSLFSRNSYNKKSPSGEQVFGSMADYYHENSAGRFQLTGTVHSWVQLPKKKAFYDKLATDPLRGQPQFLGKALDLVIAREGKDVFANVDGIAFVNAGVRGQYGRILWPHSAVFFHKGRSYDYYVMEEGGKNFAGIGTHVHEFGHVLGLPDKYGLGRRTGLGCFCVMAVGHRGKAYTKVPMEAPEKSREDAAKEIIKKNIDQIRKTLEDNLPFLKRKKAPHFLPKIPGRALINRRPLHFCAECKERFGWVDPTVLDPKSKQVIRLPAIEGNSKAVAKILLDPKGREYYLLEYRRKHKFNTGIPRSGLLIWHVGDPTAPMKNFVPFRMLDLEKAHGKDSLDSAYRAPESIPFPFGKNDRFTPRSKPSSKSIRRDAYKVWITDIKEVDGRLEFKFGHKK